jgi:hypothetical protein
MKSSTLLGLMLYSLWLSKQKTIIDMLGYLEKQQKMATIQPAAWLKTNLNARQSLQNK